jgi:multidrug efflux pump subunit AcrA (membrane-fusion protein)
LIASSSVSATDLVLNDCRVKVIDQLPLASDRAGVLADVNFREGETVTARQRVARLRDDVIQAQLAIAQQKADYTAEVSAKEKAHQISQNVYRQALDANRENPRTVPQLELEKMRLDMELASFEIERAKHELQVHKLERDQASAELQAYSILSPVSGIVTKIFKYRGEAVRQGDPVIEITSTDRVKVEGKLTLTQSFQIAQGTPVKVQVDIEDEDHPIEKQVFEGRITFVDVVVEPTSGKVKVVAEVVNHDNILRAGLKARMTVATSNPKTAAKAVIPATPASQKNP